MASPPAGDAEGDSEVHAKLRGSVEIYGLLHASALRFTPDEAAAFLNLTDLQRPPAG